MYTLILVINLCKVEVIHVRSKVQIIYENNLFYMRVLFNFNYFKIIMIKLVVIDLLLNKIMLKHSYYYYYIILFC